MQVAYWHKQRQRHEHTVIEHMVETKQRLSNVKVAVD